MSKKFGKTLRNARIDQRFTQQEVAKKIGSSQASIAKWESGDFEPKSENLRELERLFPELLHQETEDISLSGGPLFGTWLTTQRERKGLTIAELAEKAEITTATIYNLEAGRSTNPQGKTKERLEKALSEKLPEDQSKALNEKAKIDGIGALIDFNPNDSNDLPGCAGVYVFYDVTERPIYVGKSKTISERVKQHSGKKWFIPEFVATGAYVKVEDEKLRHQIEQVLIKFLKKNAVINQQSVNREED
jgi:transcriptional regulator with XRE-family HTH domain